MENLKSYLDGELDIAQQAEVETHLRNDAELQKTVEEFSAISSTFKTADSGEPYGFEKLEEKLKAAPKASIYEKKKIWRLATYWSASMACLALAATFVRSGSGSSADATASVSKARGEFKTVAPWQTRGQSDLEQDKSTSSRGETAKTINGSDLRNATPSASAGVLKDADGVSAGETEVSKPAAQDNPGGIRTQDSGIVNDSATPAKGRVMTGTPGGESDSNPESESKGDAFVGGNGTVNGNELRRTERSFNRAAPKSQWYDQSGKLKEESGRTSSGKMPASEGGFKSDMRAIRDKTTQPVTSIGDTPHGIYLERAGQVQVKVDDLMRAVNEATGMVQSFHGFVTASDLQNQADGGSATMTIRVPTDSFNATLDKLQAMGEVLSVNSNSQDITSETVDQGARMVSWADEEDRLVKELAKAKNNDQRYRIRGELRTVRANLESYRASVKSLTERAKFSTINVSFVRGDKAVKAGGTGNWSGDALKGAKDNLGSIGQVLGTLGIYFLVFSPIWLPFAIAAYYIKKKNS